jgi:hypothetical protein
MLTPNDTPIVSNSFKMAVFNETPIVSSSFKMADDDANDGEYNLLDTDERVSINPIEGFMKRACQPIKVLDID